MNRFQYVIVILGVMMMINTPTVLASSSTLKVAEEKQLSDELIDEEKRLLGDIYPKPHPSSTGSSSDGGSGGSGGGSSGGSGSGGSGSGGSGSGGSSGGSSGGGSGGSSGGGSGGSSGSSGGSSSGGGSGGTSGGPASATASDFSTHKAQKSLALMLSIAAVAGMVIAAVAIPRRKVATEANHPLKGALNRRIGIFGNLAKHTARADRPPRRDEEGRYINADSIV